MTTLQLVTEEWKYEQLYLPEYSNVQSTEKSTDGSEKHVATIFRVKEHAKQEL
jgi:hypothetical protein